MAKLSDGTVFRFKCDKDGNVSIQPEELILCKHCEYYTNTNEKFDDGTIVKNIPYCNLHRNHTNPEWYCARATHRGEYDGRSHNIHQD